MTCPPVIEYLYLPRSGLPHEFPAKAAVRLLHTQEPGASARMRKVASEAIQELQLDYTVTLVSGGASKNVEIVIWDKTRDSYFSLKLACEPGTPAETTLPVSKTNSVDVLPRCTPAVTPSANDDRSGRRTPGSSQHCPGRPSPPAPSAHQRHTFCDGPADRLSQFLPLARSVSLFHPRISTPSY